MSKESNATKLINKLVAAKEKISQLDMQSAQIKLEQEKALLDYERVEAAVRSNSKTSDAMLSGGIFLPSGEILTAENNKLVFNKKPNTVNSWDLKDE